MVLFRPGATRIPGARRTADDTQPSISLAMMLSRGRRCIKGPLMRECTYTHENGSPRIDMRVTLSLNKRVQRIKAKPLGISNINPFKTLQWASECRRGRRPSGVTSTRSTRRRNNVCTTSGQSKPETQDVVTATRKRSRDAPRQFLRRGAGARANRREHCFGFWKACT